MQTLLHILSIFFQPIWFINNSDFDCKKHPCQPPLSLGRCQPASEPGEMQPPDLGTRIRGWHNSLPGPCSHLNRSRGFGTTFSHHTWICCTSISALETNVNITHFMVQINMSKMNTELSSSTWSMRDDGPFLHPQWLTELFTTVVDLNRQKIHRQQLSFH